MVLLGNHFLIFFTLHFSKACFCAILSSYRQEVILMLELMRQEACKIHENSEDFPKQEDAFRYVSKAWDMRAYLYQTKETKK